jgi:nicotinamidase-related amidase
VNSKSALLLIDVQANMFDSAAPVAGSARLLERLQGLLGRARGVGVPVFLVRNSGGAGDPDEPGTPGWELHAGLRPDGGDVVLDKTTCKTSASTPLAAELDARDVTRVVISGLQSEYCIRETVLGAL